MADEQSTQPATTQTPPLANDPSARTETGEIKDQQASQPSTSTAEPPKPSETEGKGGKGAAPEAYADFKAPEGFEIDKETLAKATPVFKELGLSQENAQRMVDFYAQISKDAAEAPYKLYEEMRGKWRDEVIKDAALGDGTGLRSEVKSTIGRAIDSLPQDVARDFKAAMDLTGAGDNPAFIRAFYNLAQRIGEGTSVKAGAPAPVSKPGAAPKSAAAALYPNLPSSSAS